MARLWFLVAAIALAAGGAGAEEPSVAQARRLLDLAGVSGGLVVHLGCGDGRLTAALGANPRLRVHGLDPDPQNAEAARRWAGSRGLAARVWADVLRGERLPYAENTVNLLVAEHAGGIPPDEMMRVLVPNGVLLAKRGGSWVKTVKPWPKGIDQWTHWLHGPDGNAVARDTVVGPPRRLKWLAGPLWSRSHDSVPSVTSLVSARGRLFYIVDEAPASMSGAAPDNWFLVARDAFNGLELWRAPIAEWGWRAWAKRFTCRFTIPTHMPRRLVAAGDRVYVTLSFNAPLSELDAATGKVLRTFNSTEFTDEILYLDGKLILAINKAPQKPGNDDGGPEPVHKWVAALDASSGRLLWKTGDYVGLRSKTGPMGRISHLTMAAGDGQVFFIDRDRIISLDLSDGRELWRVPRPRVPEHKMRYNIRLSDMCTLVYHGGGVFFAQPNPDHRVDWREVRARVHALSARDGRELWSRQCSAWGWAHPPDVFVIDGLVWVSGYKDDFYYGLDPRSGEVRRKVSNRKAFDNGHHHRCYRNKATAGYIMTSFRGLEFIELAGGATTRNHWVRGTCRLGAFPCNGLVYAPPHPCDCYITSKLNGFVALAPAARTHAPAEPAGRLERGPAYGHVGAAPSEPAAGEWATFRHDPERSASTTTRLPARLKPLWRARLSAAPTSPAVAAGRLVVAVTDTHEVVALDAGTGALLWRYVAGGPVDTPPTLHRGMALFGCGDGWLYCLRTSDGEVAWRFRAAPADRLVCVFGRLESAWPVHGSVVVRDGRVYCTAGHSSFLDGGIYAWALDARTGEVVARERHTSQQDMDVDWGRDWTADTGVLSDILVARGKGIYLRQRPVLGTAPKSRVPLQLFATGGLLDDTWFHRNRWGIDGPLVAERLAFNDELLCGVRVRKRATGYGGHFTPGSGGVALFAAERVKSLPPSVLREPAARRRKPAPQAEQRKGRPRGSSQSPRLPKPKDLWSVRVGVRPTALAIAGDTVVVAGNPDELIPGDPWAAYEGRRGGKLLLLSIADGSTKLALDLPSPTVLDGVAIAGGRLYLSCKDGTILCLGD